MVHLIIMYLKLFDGNHLSDHFNDLTLRYSFDDNKNLDEDSSIRDGKCKSNLYTLQNCWDIQVVTDHILENSLIDKN